VEVMINIELRGDNFNTNSRSFLIDFKLAVRSRWAIIHSQNTTATFSYITG